VISTASSRSTRSRRASLRIAGSHSRSRTSTSRNTKSTALKPPSEPRFWSRVAWVHYRIGRPAKLEAKQVSDFENTDRALAHCLYYGKAVETDPTMQLVDAALSLARGLPDKTLDVAAKIDGFRPRLLRTYAFLDLGKNKEAFDEAGELLKTAGSSSGKPCEEGNDKASIEAKILCEQARMLSNEKERKQAGDELLDLARKARSKLGRHALGVAYLQLGDLANAKEHLAMAIKEISDASPNPVEYRTRTALAEIALLEKDLEGANRIVGEARNINAGYLPTQALLARIFVRNKQPDDALTLLTPILAEAIANTPIVQLTLAEALVTKKEVTDADKKNATEILTKLKDAPGIPAEEIGRIALLIDPELPKQLGVPVPAEPGKPGDKPKQPPKQPPKRPGKK
jgi:tetratricopeptide (TPR) repeat protein